MVIQEVVLSPEGICCCGDVQIPLLDILRAATWMAHCANFMVQDVQLPAFLLSTDQAHAHLRSMVHQHFSNSSPRLLATFEQLQTKVDHWTTALNAFESYQDAKSISPVESPMRCFLRVQHFLAQVFLSIARSRGGTSPHLFDHFMFNCTWILAQYDFMRFDKVLVYERVVLKPSLLIIATKTRNTQIRNEALRLLEAMKRVEAIWDSRTALVSALGLTGRKNA